MRHPAEARVLAHTGCCKGEVGLGVSCRARLSIRCSIRTPGILAESGLATLSGGVFAMDRA